MQTHTVDRFLETLSNNRRGHATGVYSVCSAHPVVIECALRRAETDGTFALIESTSNQVDQFGGYTGMRPAEFVVFVGRIADEIGFPRERIVLGGDHLGPNTWQNGPAATAIAHAERLVADYVAAGYRKIHLDTSMHCADDTGDRHEPLANEIVAERTARLCAAAEDAYRGTGTGAKPVYIVGSEVPIPGGAQDAEEELAVTSPERAAATLDAIEQAFRRHRLDDAWSRVVGLVVQPGVEFGDESVIAYDRRSARELSAFITTRDRIVYEAHSTDYQSECALAEMVSDHFCILKVGPWLTFAYREAVFALSFIEDELSAAGLTASSAPPSGVRAALDAAMTEDPRYWSKYYSGSDAERAFKRKYSLSDRSRYYWPNARVAAGVEALFYNLRNSKIPLSLISQFMPDVFPAVLDGSVDSSPGSLVRAHVSNVLGVYARACGLQSRPA
ncbi:MAG: D-tagatose-bisphosphate aldolase, class II, non-catalytic subunit [Spirochaetaceae bacterium]|nr:MAG: D-tagatose-bisphosphate aldolase, class II, non-catalytic subunit [Spirochaetaceae bacterium]